MLDLRKSRGVFFWFENKGKVIPCKGAEDRKGVGTNSGKSGVKNLEAEWRVRRESV